MLTLKRGRVSKSGTESTGELLMLGFWPLFSADASCHKAPLPERDAPLMLSLRGCSTSVGFRTATVRARWSSVQAATTSTGKVSLPALTTGCSPPGGSVGLGWGEFPETSTGMEPK